MSDDSDRCTCMLSHTHSHTHTHTHTSSTHSDALRFRALLARKCTACQKCTARATCHFTAAVIVGDAALSPFYRVCMKLALYFSVITAPIL